MCKQTRKVATHIIKQASEQGALYQSIVQLVSYELALCRGWVTFADLFHVSLQLQGNLAAQLSLLNLQIKIWHSQLPYLATRPRFGAWPRLGDFCGLVSCCFGSGIRSYPTLHPAPALFSWSRAKAVAQLAQLTECGWKSGFTIGLGTTGATATDKLRASPGHRQQPQPQPEPEPEPQPQPQARAAAAAAATGTGTAAATAAAAATATGTALGPDVHWRWHAVQLTSHSGQSRTASITYLALALITNKHTFCRSVV